MKHGLTFAADYVFRVRVLEAGLAKGEAVARFRILPHGASPAPGGRRAATAMGGPLDDDGRSGQHAHAGPT